MDSGRPKRDWNGLGSLIIAALTALVTAAISWGVNGQKIERLQQDVTVINARLERLDDARFEAAKQGPKIDRMAEDVKDLKADMKTVDQKVSALSNKRGRQ